ncbi:MAG: 1-acyl-sn-glycerol-3-phosphate acyltransferase [Parvularculaceae bacterium]|nr:1-acyl-sn-glycerol-3-phosphate acyltransferase [Parvularculaceae bacterium]
MRGVSETAEFDAVERTPSGAIIRLRGAIHIAFMAALAVAVTPLAAPFVWLGGPKVALAVIRVWAGVSLVALRVLCGISYRVEGAENLPRGRAIVACNHQSMWETVALFALLPQPAAVFKESLLKVPVYGWWGKVSGSIPVDREAGALTVRRLMREAKDRLDQGFQLIIFPEGTRVPPGATAPLQPGVAAVYLSSHAPTVPVVHDSGVFWRHPGLERRPGVITMRFLPAIPPGLAREAFHARLEDAMTAGRRDLADFSRGDRA